MTDTFRMVIIGGIASHDLEALMEGDIDTHHNDIKKPSMILSKIGDTMPGLGIVAAVLGIVITMQAIDGPAGEIGKKVAAALVGTFLGILLCYGFIQPLASNLEIAGEKEMQVFEVVKNAIVGLCPRVQPAGLRGVRPAEHSRRGPAGVPGNGSPCEGKAVSDGERIIIKKVKKRGGHEAHHGGAWKVAYADFVTAMMALFIVLWIIAHNVTIRASVADVFQGPGGHAQNLLRRAERHQHDAGPSPTPRPCRRHRLRIEPNRPARRPVHPNRRRWRSSGRKGIS